MDKIEQIIEDTANEYPYKERGNGDSYSQYNEGWSDACDILGERVKEALGLSIVTKRNWFEKLPLHWKLLYYFVGGIIVGLLLPYVC